ncbi:hypothetical protein HDF24_08910 [Mucilaginibacter sp. X4EP1]|uniref:hypothetical protein n=1 Tax=Mucilaginibacter sp. X4EP1 TaxID=2723092 RepID=UPI002169A463|nr:hypothetical protein [Mucilaginibacter sp. X4EP1]MCS3813790.1 hypothetical protein [Mucilaginibacter sp. X4EP1]
MSHRKQPERRTFLQDRLEILIKRQKSGKASFNELTELDYIVNSDPEIRKQIIMENMLMDDMTDFTEPPEQLQKEEILQPLPEQSTNLLKRIKSLLSNIFNLLLSALKNDNLSASAKQIVLL